MQMTECKGTYSMLIGCVSDQFPAGGQHHRQSGPQVLAPLEARADRALRVESIGPRQAHNALINP